MNASTSAFSFRGTLGRRGYWGRMLAATLGFLVLFHAYLLSLMAVGGSLLLSCYQQLLGVALLLCGAFAIPAGILALPLACSFMCYADPSCFPDAEGPYTCLCGALLCLSAVGMLALALNGLALAARRLRSAGFTAWLLLLWLIPGGIIVLTGLYCFPAKRAAA